MQTPTPSRGLPPILIQRRNGIVVSAAVATLFILIGLYININFTEIAADETWSLIGMAAICLAPFLSLPATRMGREDLERIQKRVIPATLFRTVWWGRRLGVIATASNAVLLVLFVLQALSTTGDNEMRDVMVADMKNLAHAAYNYRIRSAETDSSAGSYKGFAPDPSYTNLQDRSYTVKVLGPDLLQLDAIWREDPESRIQVKIGPDGRPAGPWTFTGKFATEQFEPY